MSEIKTQQQFIHQFNETHREQFNDELFKREDDEIIEELKKVIEDQQKMIALQKIAIDTYKDVLAVKEVVG